MVRNGKIARLPREIRDELNRRLENGEQGSLLLRWLNQLPDVKKLLAQEFDHVEISRQNICEWRAGGFLEWQAQQDLLAQTRTFAADAGELADAGGRPLTDHLATVLAARYAALLARWNGEENDSFDRQLRVLNGLVQAIAQLRRGDQASARIRIEEQRLEQAQSADDEETDPVFKMTPEERQQRIDEIYGRFPIPKITKPVAQTKADPDAEADADADVADNREAEEEPEAGKPIVALM